MGFKIEIRQAEGRNDSPYIHKWIPFYNVAAANHFLRSQSYDAPTRGYNKHDFKITFDDGSNYEGRLDVKHDGSDTDIIKHIREIEDYTKAHLGEPSYGQFTNKQHLKFLTFARKELEAESNKFHKAMFHTYARAKLYPKKGTPIQQIRRKEREEKVDRGQSGYFRHRKEHSINRRKAYKNRGR